MTEQHLNQPREADGKFGAMAHTEPMVRLFDRSDGSFLHPSPSATAEHCIRFWSEIDIPDEIIVQFEKAYLSRYDKLLNEAYERRMNELNNQWVAEHPVPKKEKDHQAYEAERMAYLQSKVEEVNAAAVSDCPPQLVNYDVRQLVRAFQMAWHRPSSTKFGDEGEQVLDHQIELFDGPMTVRRIYLDYDLRPLHGALEEIHTDRSTDRLVQAIREMGTGISKDLRDVEGEIYSQRRDQGYVP